jgi:ethanolamine-phosphate cytidylyltransferase
MMSKTEDSANSKAQLKSAPAKNIIQGKESANSAPIAEAIKPAAKKEIRLWMDGAFDMMHYGHMNAFRQARALGTYLIAGVNSDETITACKGRPVCNDKERVDTVRGCKWVDDVVEGVPYIMNDEYLMYVIEKYNIDYIVHGDDPCLVDGKNVYESAVKLGKYLTIPRTEGISTTDIVGRMLMMTCSHHEKIKEKTPFPSSNMLVDMEYGAVVSPATNKLVGSLGSHFSTNMMTDTEDSDVDAITQHRNNRRRNKSQFLTTSHKLRSFGAGVKPPTSEQKVVYIAGAWDMFHAGHIETLQKAKEFGDYLIVGVHNDQEVNSRYGMNLPILNLNERVLSVLGCKWVDDVLIDAPYVINQDMLSSLNIQCVVQAFPHTLQGKELPLSTIEEIDPYELPRVQGILQHVFINYNLSALDFVERIQEQRDRFAIKFEKKAAAEKEFYKNKYSL